MIIIKDFLSVGRIINTHGVRGEMKLDVWCDSLDSLKRVTLLYTDSEGKNAVKVISKRVHGNFLLITLEGVDSIEAAYRFKGKELFAARGDIPKAEGSYFIADLIGLTVYDAATNEVIGKVSDVFNRGAGDILEVKRENGKEALIPMVKDFMAKIDTDEGIFVNVVEGLVD